MCWSRGYNKPTTKEFNPERGYLPCGYDEPTRKEFVPGVIYQVLMLKKQERSMFLKSIMILFGYNDPLVLSFEDEVREELDWCQVLSVMNKGFGIMRFFLKMRALTRICGNFIYFSNIMTYQIKKKIWVRKWSKSLGTIIVRQGDLIILWYELYHTVYVTCTVILLKYCLR